MEKPVSDPIQVNESVADMTTEPRRWAEPVVWTTVADKLEHASPTVLRRLMHGGIGEPETDA